jgi:hypothetical protein
MITNNLAVPANKSNQKDSKVVLANSLIACLAAIGQGMDKQYSERFEDAKRVDYQPH